MEARSIRLLKLLGGENQFVIPIFQRNYAWEEKHCQQLWKDIVRSGESSNIKKHFTGSIVYIPQNSSIGGAVLVIDGQQRMTTVILLLEALARRISTYEEINEFNSNRIRKKYLYDETEEGENRFKLLLSDTDKDSLKEILKGGDPATIASNAIKRNFNFFVNKLAPLNEEEIFDVIEGIGKLSIVDLALDAEDNPQLIFESMNSTGKNLSQADLIRNFILMGLDKSEQEALYSDFWRPMEKSFGSSYESDFGKFMRTYLTVKMKEIPKIDEVYDVFKYYVSDKGLSSEDVVKDIKKYAEYFATISYDNKPSIDEDVNKEIIPIFVNLVRKMKNNIVLPVVLMLYSDYMTSDLLTIKDLKKALNTLESYYVRRFVCGLAASNMNIGFEGLIQTIDKNDYLNSFIEILTSNPATSRKFPDDKEFKEALVSRELYTSPLLKYILERIQNHNKKDAVNILAAKDITIEHVMPQNENLNKSWQEMLGENWKEIQREYLHTLGNLTVTHYNSEYADKPYMEKVKAKNAQGISIGLASSTFDILNDEFTKETYWNGETIEARAQRLAHLATEIWARPKNIATVTEINIVVDKNQNNDEDEELNDFLGMLS